LKRQIINSTITTPSPYQHAIFFRLIATGEIQITNKRWKVDILNFRCIATSMLMQKHSSLRLWG